MHGVLYASSKLQNFGFNTFNAKYLCISLQRLYVFMRNTIVWDR